MNATQLTHDYGLRPQRRRLDQYADEVSNDVVRGGAPIGRIGRTRRRRVSIRFVVAQEQLPQEEEGAVDTARIFHEQAARWMHETAFTSSLSEIIGHPAYLRIIGLGKPVLPLIFQALRAEPAHWFVALMSITGEDPIAGRYDLPFDDMASAWLHWGTEHGYG